MLHTDLDVFTIIPLIALWCSHHPTTFPNTLPCSLPFCCAPHLSLHLLLPALGHHSTNTSALCCWGSGVGCPPPIQEVKGSEGCSEMGSRRGLAAEEGGVAARTEHGMS